MLSEQLPRRPRAQTTGLSVVGGRKDVAKRLAQLQDRVEALRVQSADALERRRASQSGTAARSVAWNPHAETWEWIITTRKACPNCRCEAIQPAPRRSRFEFALSRIALPFQCEECGTRFFVSGI